MTDLHRRLIDALRDRFDNYRVEVDRRDAALRAVIERHAPVKLPLGATLYCDGCRNGTTFDECPDLRTIAENLGVRDDDGSDHD